LKPPKVFKAASRDNVQQVHTESTHGHATQASQRTTL